MRTHRVHLPTSGTPAGLIGLLMLVFCSFATAQVNTWVNVTPPELPVGSPIGQFSVGVFDVVSDPVRPTDFYAFTTFSGVWKSTDCGLTWSRITGPDVMTLGAGWGAAIEQNPNRDPNTPPKLWTCQGYGGWEGVWISTDGGVTWTGSHTGVDGKDGIYSYDIDPYDRDHLLAGLHEATGILESTDGGASWRFIATPGSGNSIYPFFVNTGNPATTRTTWLEVGQIDAGGKMYRTTNSGADWNQVLAAGHPHGSSQLYTDNNRHLYFAGFGSGGGVFKSTNNGENWTMVSSISGTSIVGTPNYIYASSCDIWPSNCGTGGNPKPQRAPAATGTSWQSMTIPPCMNDGGHRMAVGFDGTHYVVISGNCANGIWRYVESEAVNNSHAINNASHPEIHNPAIFIVKEHGMANSGMYPEMFNLRGIKTGPGRKLIQGGVYLRLIKQSHTR